MEFISLYFKKYNEIYIILAIFLILLIGRLIAPWYLTAYNLSCLFRQLSMDGLVALGMTFVIIGGGIDLSVGSVFGISTMIAISLQNKVINSTGSGFFVGLDFPLILVLFFGLLSGAIFGLINGLGVIKLRIPPFIMTLATMFIGRGLIMAYSRGFQFRGVKEGFMFLGGGKIGEFIPMSLIIFIFFALLTYWTVHYFKFGRELFATGSNSRAAWLSGIKTDSILLITYIVSGLFAALAGMLFCGFTTTADPWAGEGLELKVISAVLVGGTPLLGGEGSIMGTIFGVLFIGLLGNLLTLLNIGPYKQQLTMAIIIAIVVLLQSQKERKKL
jgi:ribose/xylose/arabinose/galactoside ABC-type transport system permease subunit